MMPVTGAPSRDSEVHVMSRNHRRSRSTFLLARIDVEQLETRKLMAADVAIDADELLLDQYLASRQTAPAAAAVSVDDLTLQANVGGSGNGLTLNSSPGSKSSVPQVWVNAPAYGIRGTDALFTVSLDRAPGASPVTLKYATQNGGAAAGVDFKATSGTLTFSGNETFKTIAVPVLANAPVRTPKPSDFSVVLSAATNGKIVADSSTTSIVNDREGFQIDINFIGNVPLIVQGAAKAAVNKWQSAIIADLPPVVVGGKFIDDFLMNVQMGLIGGMKSDGKDGVLANAWPMDPDGTKPAIRSNDPKGNHTAYLGTTGIDPADTDFANLTAVLTHEMGHALGIGSFWKYQNFFKEFPDLKLIAGAKTDTPTYVGANAIAQYQSYGKTATAVPVQPYVLGHWDEDYLGNELMTPYADEGRNPLSRVTLGALADLGYTVNYGRAESFTPNGALASTAGGGRSGGSGSGSSGVATGILTGGWGVVVTVRTSSSQASTSNSQTGGQGGTPSATTITITPTTQQQQPLTPARPATATRQFVIVRQGQAPVMSTTPATVRPTVAAGFATYGK